MTTPPPPRGYSATKEQLLARLRRVEGQVRGIERMVEEERWCIDVLTQISAVQAALDKIGLGLVDGHARHCLRQGAAHGGHGHGDGDGDGHSDVGGHGHGDGHSDVDVDAMIDEMMGAVGRLIKRG